MNRLLILAPLLALGVVTLAQSQPPGLSSLPTTTPEETPAVPPVELSKPATPPAGPPPTPEIKLGLRVETLRQQLKVRPTVVIVPDGASYLRAIERWAVKERFPILIDDGSDESRENIARFVRTFAPKTVVRWTPEAQERQEAWPADAVARQASIERSAARAWDREDTGELRAYWQELEFAPPGIVVGSADDPAWTAALALAAAHGQPFVWTQAKPGNPSEEMSAEVFASLDDAITKGLESLGIGYLEVGDEIESITLCQNLPARIPASAAGGSGAALALTDRLGRDATGKRFAWSGMIFGTESEAAYRAMCAIFLRPKRAWIFDGYARDFAPPYAGERARDVLLRAGFAVDIDGPPRGNLAAWRERVRGGIDAGLILVNSSGHSGWFDLTPGRGTTSDLPTLRTPAIVHFIHSFSAQWAADPATLSGRFLRNGAYAYIGAMDEPYLNAFFPGEIFVSRLLALMPLGAAVRQQDQPVWKINLFGDPLITLARPVPRFDDPMTLEGAVSLEDDMKAALKKGDLAVGTNDLVMLGRDADAVLLAKATLRDKKKNVNPEFARAALGPAIRAMDASLVTGLYRALPADIAKDRVNADLLWQIARPLINAPNGLEESEREALVGLLRTSIRDASMAEDARLIAPSIKRLYGPGGVESMLTELLARATDEETKKKLREALSSF